jgi:single-strand DNA-binding protein
MLIGNIGKTPETRTTNNNHSVSNFSIATTHGYKDKQGDWQNTTTWHNIQAWNLSEKLLAQLAKGNKVYVEGRLNTRDYTDKEGNKRYITEVITETIIPLTGKGEQQNNQSDYNEDKGYSRDDF